MSTIFNNNFLYVKELHFFALVSREREGM